MDMQRFQKWTMVVLLGLSVVVLAACGGGGGSSSSTPSETPAVTFTLSGTVTTSGTQLSGVALTLTGSSGTVTTSTAADGTYIFTGLANGNYTLTPSLAGYTFSPVSTAVTVNNTDVTGAGGAFTATAGAASTHSISGTVSGVVAKGVMVTLNGDAIGSAFTDENGNYTFSGLVAGNYTVTPSLSGYAFSSAGAVTISAGDSTLNNFVAAAAPSGSSLVFAPAVSLPDATVGTAYSNSVVLNISGGSPPYHYQSDSFATGAPPIGMIVDLNGNLTGIPRVAGTYTFGVCAVDLGGASSCGTTTISVISVTTFSGSFSGSGSFSRVFPGFTTCTFDDSFSGTITVTMTTRADGSTSSSAHVVGNWVSTAVSGSTINFACLDTSTTWDNTLQTSGALPSIAWTDLFTTPGGSNVTGNFTGTLSGSTITGTQVETIDTSSGSASLPITLTKQ